MYENKIFEFRDSDMAGGVVKESRARQWRRWKRNLFQRRAHKRTSKILWEVFVV